MLTFSCVHEFPGEVFLKHYEVVLQFIYSITKDPNVSDIVNQFAVGLLG
jgi:hypothetical protein